MCQIEKLKLHYRKCTKQEEFVGIVWKGETIWLCERCWAKVAESDFEWGKDKKISWRKMKKQMQKEIKEAIPTEYTPHKKSVIRKKRRKRK